MTEKKYTKKQERCPIRGHKRSYFPAIDMFACLECDAWLSNICGCPPGCGFDENWRVLSRVERGSPVQAAKKIRHEAV